MFRRKNLKASETSKKTIVVVDPVLPSKNLKMSIEQGNIRGTYNNSFAK